MLEGLDSELVREMNKVYAQATGEAQEKPKSSRTRSRFSLGRVLPRFHRKAKSSDEPNYVFILTSGLESVKEYLSQKGAKFDKYQVVSVDEMSLDDQAEAVVLSKMMNSVWQQVGSLEHGIVADTFGSLNESLAQRLQDRAKFHHNYQVLRNINSQVDETSKGAQSRKISKSKRKAAKEKGELLRKEGRKVFEDTNIPSSFGDESLRLRVGSVSAPKYPTDSELEKNVTILRSRVAEFVVMGRGYSNAIDAMCTKISAGGGRNLTVIEYLYDEGKINEQQKHDLEAALGRQKEAANKWQNLLKDIPTDSNEITEEHLEQLIANMSPVAIGEYMTALADFIDHIPVLEKALRCFDEKGEAENHYSFVSNYVANARLIAGEGLDKDKDKVEVFMLERKKKHWYSRKPKAQALLTAPTGRPAGHVQVITPQRDKIVLILKDLVKDASKAGLGDAEDSLRLRFEVADFYHTYTNLSRQEN